MTYSVSLIVNRTSGIYVEVNSASVTKASARFKDEQELTQFIIGLIVSGVHIVNIVNLGFPDKGNEAIAFVKGLNAGLKVSMYMDHDFSPDDVKVAMDYCDNHRSHPDIVEVLRIVKHSLKQANPAPS